MIPGERPAVCEYVARTAGFVVLGDNGAIFRTVPPTRSFSRGATSKGHLAEATTRIDLAMPLGDGTYMAEGRAVVS